MKTGSLILLICCFVLALACMPLCMAGTTPVITLHDQKECYIIGGKVALLEDKKACFTIQQVQGLNTSFKQSLKEIPVFGPSSSAVWCSFKARNKSQEDKWYLEVGSSYLNQVDLYEQTPNGVFRRVKGGAQEPFISRSIKTNRIILPLQLPPGAEQIYYIRFQSRSILRFPIQIATMPALYQSNHTFDLANGIYFGLMISLVIFTLFVYSSLKDKGYLYYILYIVCLTLDVASVRGYLLEWLPQSLVWLINNRLFSGMAIFFGVLFTNEFLNVKRRLPTLYPWRYAIYASVAIIFLLNLLHFYVWSFAWMLITFIPTFAYIYSAGIIIYRQGFKPALYYTIAFAAIGLGIIIYILKDINLLPENAFTEGALQLGSVIEAIVLSFALASKFSYYKQEKSHAQEIAIRQANAFSQQLIQSQEHERKRIAAELHDSVGQSLMLIKNKVHILRKQINEPLKADLHAEDLTENITHTINEVRSISYALRPFQLDMLGLTQSICSLADEVAEASGIAVSVDADNIDELFPKNEEINLYRIVQECLNNIVKHSGATHAKLSLTKTEQVVQLKIEDNGKGIKTKPGTSKSKHGFGLLGIQERINILAGNWLIKEATPHGTIIHISIPIAIAHANT